MNHKYCCEPVEKAIKDGYVYERIVGKIWETREYYISRIIKKTDEKVGDREIFCCPFCGRGFNE